MMKTEGSELANPEYYLRPKNLQLRSEHDTLPHIFLMSPGANFACKGGGITTIIGPPTNLNELFP